ncbi:hypothetical protein LEP1GSC043_2035 [Leptospira weilii str. Ecochallenge]|uniref:Uncharacterized protein n=1 Tax=Leptospira weilii str. Ecochallenge TaxID=1049986 RepID=N1UBN5_9LEPT|nr:hypothetical protein [Leptospira weilii]EMY13450.1 hypothetical protein LEP1GSC043_2035 [Leptospira weilii str. Ecochallenge]
MQIKIMEYFQRRVKIFTFEKPAWVWMLNLIGAILEIFPPFTERTVWALWISFSLLAASFFMDRLPASRYSSFNRF